MGLQDTVKAVAAILGGKHFCSEGNDSYARIIFKDGSGCVFYKHHTGNKLEITGIWPENNKNEQIRPGMYEDTLGYQSIGVSADKLPEKIARDIQNRFMPGYIKLFNELAKRRDASNEYNDKADAIKKHVEDFRKAYKTEDRRNIHIDSQSTSIKIVIDSLTPEQAVIILNAYSSFYN